MPCDTIRNPQETPQQRQAKVAAALKKLGAEIASGRVTLRIGAQGAAAFSGWNAAYRDGVTDVCAFRKLMVANDFAFKQALQKAEMLAGRKVDMQQVAAGTHSHDHGNTWHKGH